MKLQAARVDQGRVTIASVAEQAGHGVLVLALLVPVIYGPQVLFPFHVPRALFVRVLIGAAAVLCAGALAVRGSVRGRFHPVGAGGLLAAFAIWSAVAGLSGWAWQRSLFGSLARMGGVVMFLYGAVFLLAIRWTFTERWYRRLLWGCLAGASGAAIYGLGAVYVPGVERLATAGAGMIGTLGNPGFMGAVAVIGAWSGGALLEGADGWPTRIVAALGTLICGTGILLSESRAALLGLGAGVLVATAVWLVSAGRETRRRVLLAGVGVVVAGGVAAAAFVLATVGDITVLGPGAEGIQRLARAARGLGTRLGLSEIGLRAVADHQLFGVGHENYLLVFDRYVDPSFRDLNIQELFFDRAHNAYVGHAVATGVPGLLLYLAVWLVPCSRAVRAAREGRAGAARVALLVGGVVSYLGYLVFWFEDTSSFVLAVGLLACVDRAGSGSGEEAASGQDTETRELGTAGRWLTVGLAAIFAAGTLYHAVGVWRSARGLAVATRIPSMVERSRVLREAVERAPPGVGEADERLLFFAARMSRHRDRIRRVPGARTAAERAYRTAGSVYEERTDWDPRNARFRFYGAGYMLSAWRHFEERGYLERAIETTRTAVEHAPLRFRYRHQLARLLLLVERRSEAAGLLEEGLERYDGHAETHALLARTRLEMGQVRPAYRSAERALELNGGALEPSLADRLIQRLEERGASAAANRIRRLRR